MATPQFVARFDRYLQDAHQAQTQDVHHDQRRELFLAFLHDAFGIDMGDVEREQYIQLSGRQVAVAGTARVRKGWIDAIFRDLIFEFKRDLKRETAEGLRELRDYLSNIPNGDECVGLLTDGLVFTAYSLDAAEATGLIQIDSIDLAKQADTQDVAYLWLDAYLLSQRNVAPTSADIVRRFGLNSPTFVTAARALRQALATFEASESGAAEVKRQQWAFYLARVYGSADARNDEMFVRHTYLCQFAKVLAYVAYFDVGRASDEIEGVISGRAFEALGVGNIGEQDFFAWTLAPEVRTQTLDIFRHIAASLTVYNLRRIDEDLLKQLYQNLVEPETRHELGEFYTPDWLAELTLREIDYRPGQSLLDPSCGSGTFLFTAIRLLSERGLRGEALVDFALEHIMGVDVHPLAVTIARLNYMLAILPHLQGAVRRARRNIPIAMANSLLTPEKSGPVAVVSVRFDAQRDFRIPIEAASHPNELAQVLDEMQLRAERLAPEYPNLRANNFGATALATLSTESGWSGAEYVRTAWDTNLRYLAEQIARKRDSIWVYVLQNTCQPLILQHRKFDVIVGNPPWIAYRYLQDESYRNDVKTLTREYGLLETSETKLNTQMEISTVFYEHCYRAYLKLGGVIAFVMPRSVITGAKQHRAFQRKGFSRILDLKEVAPLFNVPSCVLIRDGATPAVDATPDATTVAAADPADPADATPPAPIPTEAFSGRLPTHEYPWRLAVDRLTHTPTSTSFAGESAIASPYYHPRFKQGATLVPRNLVFVASAQPNLRPGELAYSTVMETDPDVDAEAKVPWKGLRLQGHIDESFLYATLLSKNLSPFGVRKLHLVALPVRVETTTLLTDAPGQPGERRFVPLSLAELRESDTLDVARSANDWFLPAERLWEQHKSPNSKMALLDRLDYQKTLSEQSAEPGYLVVYNAAGSNLAAAVLDTRQLPIINGVRPTAFVVEHKMYWYRCAQPEEAHYLAALLNAPSVDAAIKPTQTQGTFGPRDIERRPFEVVAIPAFDPADADHQQLAALSQQAHALVAAGEAQTGGVVAARKHARTATADVIVQIDVIARRVVGG
ncbi:MAG TPA: N-6 DNA methylase [Ktedonobacterales bacterium]|nr:N-6 DNA methylase [Ktedonobacterales bacterium]